MRARSAWEGPECAGGTRFDEAALEGARTCDELESTADNRLLRGSALQPAKGLGTCPLVPLSDNARRSSPRVVIELAKGCRRNRACFPRGIRQLARPLPTSALLLSRVPDCCPTASPAGALLCLPLSPLFRPLSRLACCVLRSLYTSRTLASMTGASCPSRRQTASY